MSNYRKLLEQALNQGARTTKWNVIIPDNGRNELTLSLLAKDIILPSLGVKEITMKYKGRDIPIAGPVKISNEFSITFMVDQEHRIRKYFEDWILKFDARGFQTSVVDSNYESQLKGSIGDERSLYRNITLLQYPFDADIDPETAASPAAQYTFYGCFPTNISEFSYSNDNESIFDLKVQFKCSHYQRDR